MMNQSNLHIQDPFLHPVINTKEAVVINNITEMQRAIFDTYPHTFYTLYQKEIFHLNSGANVHATNDKNNCLISIQLNQIFT